MIVHELIFGISPAQYLQLCPLLPCALPPFTSRLSIPTGIMTYCGTSVVPADARSEPASVVLVGMLCDRTEATVKGGSGTSTEYIVSQTVICRWTSTTMTTEYIP